ncbi:MarR family transcriptional regulator [Halobacteria archaeon AArc-m2/3/4]|uniref:MarR family transcriptional regulator n=1 Tax=Natronoglomus mannanivorans TaxID=2979990 RepID=A0AAP2Z1A5_9EURY|nr:MarR family transcriptional regulator [Halobacteria archaeon AArc-xg1-1]MCU4974129.1 MarR family transcriptional regulator [Halobacteria archaeon AArc-m2/3/4]
MPSAGATWELVLVTLLFVLLAVLFALRLWAALSRASTDGRSQIGTRSETDRTETASTKQTGRYTRSASSPGANPTRHELSAELQSDLGSGFDTDADSDFDPRSIPRDVLAESLSDEDRVLRMLAANDGRLRQQVIVERTDWSKSKVSRLLSKMNEKGSIEKISVGRENVITFPSNDPEDEPLEETR